MKGEPGQRKKRILRAVLVGYTLAMLWLLFGQRVGSGVEGRLNLEPLDTVRRYLWVLEHSENTEAVSRAYANLAGNILLFVPAGILLPAVFVCMRRGLRLCLLSAVGIALVELLQLVTGLGSCDIDDLLFNLLGTMAGFGIWTVSTAIGWIIKRE